MNYKPVYALILFAVTAITYGGGLCLQHKRRKRSIIFVLTLAVIMPLLIFKYYNFLNSTMISILSQYGVYWNLPGLNWAIPIGISFFTFQALGYLFDVYFGKIKPEKCFIDYMLFCSFFPQIASGPISKASELLPQIKDMHPFSYSQAKKGLWLLLWGMFIKLFIADRLGLYVDVVFGHFTYYSGITCFIASIFYTIQIYCDFCGYSLMAVGIGKTLGYNLIENFSRPYFAASITEFWKRWHISLTRWLTSYIYIPLGGNRCSRLRCYFNIMITFLVSGLWHGANWTFIIWGTLHGIIQIIEKYFGIQKANRNNNLMTIFRILVTFIIINFAWIFFRMPTFEDAISIIYRIFTNHEITLYYASLGDLLLYIIGISILFAKEFHEEFTPKSLKIVNQHYIKWGICLFLFGAILCEGVLDSGSFIYVSF